MMKLELKLTNDWLEATWIEDDKQVHCESFSGHPEHIAMLRAKALEFGTTLDESLIKECVANFVMPEEPTLEELEAKAVQEWKTSRTLAVATIKVMVDEMEFDGDETSQTRMTRAITAMDDTETTPWVLADNTPVLVSKATLVKALKLAGEAQTALWIYS